MARTKSTFNALGNRSSAVSDRSLFRVGAYLRLSKEDDSDTGASVSITNQQSIIETYIDDHPEFVLIETYIDDGITGATDNRESFQRLINDCKKKKINCVIVKDPSRFARNYADIERYVEEVFKLYGIRFICLDSPRVDSLKDPVSVSGMQFHFTNYFNEYFVKQTSEKIKQTFENKMKKGELITGWSMFGYNKIKDHNGKAKYVINPDEALVVQQIFDLFTTQFYSLRKIAIHLNETGVPSLMEFRKIKGENLVIGSQKSKINGWNYNAIKHILSDERYLGHTIQGKTKKISYKSKVKVKADRDEWYVVYNTHTPIIDDTTFEKAQKLLARPSRESHKTGEKAKYAGLLFCHNCGNSLNRKKSGRLRPDGTAAFGYVCTFAHNTNKCEQLHIYEHTLDEMVLHALQSQIVMIADLTQVVTGIRSKKHKHDTTSLQQISLAHLKNQLDSLETKMHRLYDRYDDDEISRDLFESRLQALEAEKQALSTKAQKAQHETEKITDTDKNISDLAAYVASFKKHKTITTLDRELLLALVDKILVKNKPGAYPRNKRPKELTVVFDFRDQFELLEHCRAKT